MRDRTGVMRLALTIVVALAVGGLAGAGVALEWYPPYVGIGLAALIGLALGSRVRRVARQWKRGASAEDRQR